MHKHRFHDRSGTEHLLDDLIHTLGRADILNILRVLAEGPATCRAISLRMELDDSAISTKLGVLRRLGLVQYTQRKKNHIYSVSPAVQLTCSEETFELRITLEDGQRLSMSSHYYAEPQSQLGERSESSPKTDPPRPTG